MITLILMGLCISASCLAAAGLIASAQNNAANAESMMGLTIDHPDAQT